MADLYDLVTFQIVADLTDFGGAATSEEFHAEALQLEEDLLRRQFEKEGSDGD